jgi:microcystin-dependent protein
MLKKIITLILLAVLFSSAFAQTKKLPVQGKLFENNLPVTGNRNLGFSIAAIGWNQTLNNVAVSEGLYAVELDVPADLFATQVAHDLSITVNGTPLSTVKVHAPIESDPTVPASLKDGVSWNEITNKPTTIDLDITNEIQTLTIQGTELSISGGNTVELPTGGSGSGAFDTLVVGPPKLAIVTSPSILTGSSSEFRQTVTQTFIAESTGRLVSIEVWCANSNTASIDFKVRPVGNGQSVADNFFVPSAFSPIFSYQTFTPLTSNAPLTQYTQYIIEFNVTGGATYGFGYDSNDPYKFGQSNIVSGNLADLKFKVNIEKTVGPNFTVNSDGNVGIGTDNPTSKLTVNGRIEDETGFIMPVGSILPWAGPAGPTGNSPIPPKGWLVCDGSEVSRAVYSDLFQAIGTNWGEGTGPNAAEKFKVPELRGWFLRGWSGDSNYDPEKNTRFNINNSQQIGNLVGSYQNDAFQYHSHRIPRTGNNAGSNGFWGGGNVDSYINANDITTQSGQSSPRVASETRARNASVLYIIKY